jgi:mono/diheme cytochrome c family protein
MKLLAPICLVGMLFSQLLAADGSPSTLESSFQRCAACHLASGEGVPGAFPPLKGRIAKIASTAEGRSYLIAVVNTGLMGSITIDGVPYMGVMPAQGSSYDANGIRDVLNYSVQVLDGDNVQTQWQPFSNEEVQAVIDVKSPTSGMENGQLRQGLISKYPDLQ